MSASILPQDFYVYLHRKATTGEVFYVGKGTGDRAWRAGSANRGSYWCRVAEKHGVNVEIFADQLQEWYAHELEQELIALHGRRDLGYGPLVNMTDGGDGASGVTHSDETKARTSASVRKSLSSPVVRAKISNAGREAWARPGAKERRSATISATWSSQEIREKRISAMSSSQKGRPKSKKQLIALPRKPVQCIEMGVVFESVACAVRWLRENGSPTASKGNISTCCTGGQKTAYGYTWRYAA